MVATTEAAAPIATADTPIPPLPIGIPVKPKEAGGAKALQPISESVAAPATPAAERSGERTDRPAELHWRVVLRLLAQHLRLHPGLRRRRGGAAPPVAVAPAPPPVVVETPVYVAPAYPWGGPYVGFGWRYGWRHW